MRPRLHHVHGAIGMSWVGRAHGLVIAITTPCRAQAHDVLLSSAAYRREGVGHATNPPTQPQR